MCFGLYLAVAGAALGSPSGAFKPRADPDLGPDVQDFGPREPQVTGGDHGLAPEIVITPKCALTRESPYYYYLLITV